MNAQRNPVIQTLVLTIQLDPTCVYVLMGILPMVYLHVYTFNFIPGKRYNYRVIERNDKKRSCICRYFLFYAQEIT